MYLQRLKARPSLDDLPAAEARYIHQHFDIYAGEVVVHQQPIAWDAIEAVEVVKSPRASGPAGWFVRHVVHGDERYHVGLYFGRQEAVLPNVSLSIARFIVQSVAFYAPVPVRYVGPDGLSPVTPA